ncbi:MAG: hypothetical protein PHR47_01550 [Candidatus Pacebacteria bacterium]|nr:hypothetical protein [Candidatus Paceibacterota bacterium]
MNKKLIFIISSILLVLVLFFFWQKMAFDKGILKLEIIGPDKVNVGEEFEYIVKYKNNGSINLENPEMIFSYPDGAIIDNGKIKKITSDELGGTIYPGQERTMKFAARLLGKEGELKKAEVKINFQPQDLKIRNETNSSFSTILDKLPLSLSLDIPQKSGAGRPITVKISYSSGVPYPLKDLSCSIEYPADFQFVSAKPKGMDDKQWDIPILNESDGGKIEISGILNGNPQDQKVFKAKIGVWQDGNFIVLKEANRGVAIIAPSVQFTEKINNQEGYTVNMGDRLHYEVSFRNVGEEAMKDLALIIKLEGSGLNYNSIQAGEGVYQKGDNSLIWDGNQVSELQDFSVNTEGKVEFWITTNKTWTMKSQGDKNPFIKTKITLGQIKQEFLNKINSSLSATQSIRTDSKIFSDSGPMPVMAYEKTAFTVEWTAKNSYNDITNAKMTTVLPSGVRFIEGQTKVPDGTKIFYDEGTRQLTWEIGSLEAGTGIFNEAKSCAFQLSINPETIDTDVLLIGASQLSGTDLWTNSNLITSTDPNYSK